MCHQEFNTPLSLKIRKTQENLHNSTKNISKEDFYPKAILFAHNRYQSNRRWII